MNLVNMLLHHRLSRPMSLPTAATNANANKGSLLLDMTKMRHTAMLCKLSVSTSLDLLINPNGISYHRNLLDFCEILRSFIDNDIGICGLSEINLDVLQPSLRKQLEMRPKISSALLLSPLPPVISALGLLASQAALSLVSRTNFAEGAKHRVPTHTDSADGHTSNFAQKAVAP
jgi:hypothetical protein